MISGSARGEGVRDFGYKLRLTVALLGCASQKDLCARFRAVNPETTFELERSYKWMRGRALPRSGQVYEDWATLLDMDESTARLLSCSAEQFLDLICAHHDVSREALVTAAAAYTRARPVASEAAPSRARFCGRLAGAYACYSHAWTPYFEGRIVRGSLIIGVAAGRPGPMATYGKRIALGHVQLNGPVRALNRTIYLDLIDAGEEFRLSMCLFTPGTLANVLAGVMFGASLVDVEPQPAATRIVMIRIPAGDATQLEDSNRYIDLAEEPFSSDLDALGLPAAVPGQLNEVLEGFLRGDHARAYVKADARQYARLALAIDRLVIETDADAGGRPLSAPARRSPRDAVQLVTGKALGLMLAFMAEVEWGSRSLA